MYPLRSLRGRLSPRRPGALESWIPRNARRSEKNGFYRRNRPSTFFVTGGPSGFTGEIPADRETLARLIDMARYTPSGHNLQPVRWLVIYESAEVRRMAGLVADWMRYLCREKNPLALTFHMDRIVAFWDSGVDNICRSAPHLIIAHAPKEERSAPAACTLALGYLELAAPSLGLGACWAGFFQAAAQFWPPLQEALPLPDGHSSFGAMMVGYPKYHYQRLPLRNPAVITWKG